jgi:hypothetical protein
MIKTRLFPLVLAATAAIAVAGCGGSGDSSSSDPASLVAPGALVYVEGNLWPSGSLKSNADAVAQTIAGVDNLGEFIAEELESSARDDGEPFDFEKEVEPWLGERAGLAFAGLEDGDLTEPLIVVETTDAEATQDFIDSQTGQSKDPYEDGSYKGIDFELGGSEEQAIGVVGDSLVVAEGEAGFKAAVDASQGESLADEARFSGAFSAASDGSLADAYVDVGGLIDASEGGGIDPQAQEALKSAGIDPSDATAVASAIPGTDQIEIDLSSDLGGEEAPSGDASELLGSMPAESFAAVGATGFNDQLKKAVDELDAAGIPSQGVPPNKLSGTLRAMGIDLDKIASSLEGAAVFATGSNEGSLGGALVLTSGSGEAAKTVANLGVLLRNTGTAGVTAVSGGGASGFSIRSDELGDKPLVVVAKEKRVAIGYGLAPALRGLADQAETLSDTDAYEEAVSALGDTPIGAFVNGPAALGLAEALVPRSEEDFWKARPYLKKVAYVALGSGSDGDLATATLIAGLKK